VKISAEQGREHDAARAAFIGAYRPKREALARTAHAVSHISVGAPTPAGKGRP